MKYLHLSKKNSKRFKNTNRKLKK